MAGSEPAIFAAGERRLGPAGLDQVTLAAPTRLTLRSALLTAWRNVAPAKLRKAMTKRPQRRRVMSVDRKRQPSSPSPLASPSRGTWWPRATRR